MSEKRFLRASATDKSFLNTLIYSEFGKDPVTARSIKLYFCRKHSGEKLGTIGTQSGIEDGAVAQSCKRLNLKLEKDGKLKEKMQRFEKRVFLSNVET
jgi:hypothetical protein